MGHLSVQLRMQLNINIIHGYKNLPKHHKTSKPPINKGKEKMGQKVSRSENGTASVSSVTKEVHRAND